MELVAFCFATKLEPLIKLVEEEGDDDVDDLDGCVRMILLLSICDRRAREAALAPLIAAAAANTSFVLEACMSNPWITLVTSIARPVSKDMKKSTNVNTLHASPYIKYACTACMRNLHIICRHSLHLFVPVLRPGIE